MKQIGIKKCIAAAAVLALIFCLCACGGRDDALSAEETAAIEEILGDNTELTSMTEEVLTASVAEENDSVEKVYSSVDGDYVFICTPVGYNGPIRIMLAIDGATNKTLGMRIIEHMETDHYVRDMESSWFVDRFRNKDALVYLERVKLEAEKENQIVAITGSTVTTDAIIKGVNDAFGVYRTIENPHYQGAAPGTLALSNADGEEIGTLTVEQLKTLDSYRRKMVVHTSVGDEEHDYRGVRLSEAISLVDPELLSKHTSISVIGTDSYTAEITMEEVFLENNAYLMYEDYDQPIQTITGQEGGIRLVILKDDFGQRFTNDVLELRFQ